MSQLQHPKGAHLGARCPWLIGSKIICIITGDRSCILVSIWRNSCCDEGTGADILFFEPKNFIYWRYRLSKHMVTMFALENDFWTCRSVFISDSMCVENKKCLNPHHGLFIDFCPSQTNLWHFGNHVSLILDQWDCLYVSLSVCQNVCMYGSDWNSFNW